MLIDILRKRGDLMVSTPSGPGSSPGQGDSVVFLNKTLYLLGGNPAMEKHPTQGGRRKIPSGFILMKPEITAGLMDQVVRVQTLHN